MINSEDKNIANIAGKNVESTQIVSDVASDPLHDILSLRRATANLEEVFVWE